MDGRATNPGNLDREVAAEGIRVRVNPARQGPAIGVLSDIIDREERVYPPGGPRPGLTSG